MDLKIPSDTYFSFLTNRPLMEVWSIFLLSLARLVPAIAFAPFLGGKAVSDTMKLGFGVLISFIFLPFLVVHSKASLEMDLMFWLLMVKEAVIGSLLGFFISIPFYILTSAGALIDHQRGSQSLQVMEPTTQMQTSPEGTLFNDVMIVTFFWTGGAIFFFDAIFTSYTVLPVDQFFPAGFFDHTKPLWLTTLELLNTFVKIALQLSAPALIAMLLSDLFLGIANRMAPQVQISFLMWSLKAYVGIALVWAGWWLLLRQMETEAIAWTKLFQKLVNSLG